MKEEITRKIRKHFKLKDSKNKVHQNLWTIAKTGLREQFKTLSVYSRNVLSQEVRE